MNPSPRNGRMIFGAACAAALLAVALAYANHFHNSFHFDDWHTVAENPAIRSLANVPGFFRDGRTFSVWPANASYRPLVSATLALDYWLGWMPWATVCGALLGLVGGMAHLVTILNRQTNGPAQRQPGRGVRRHGLGASPGTHRRGRDGGAVHQHPAGAAATGTGCRG